MKVKAKLDNENIAKKPEVENYLNRGDKSHFAIICNEL